MSSFFGKLRGAASTTGSSLGSPSKKDAPNQPQTSLGKLLVDGGPLRIDGSDRFFGMENFGSSCYCNSILQSLYYSAPFREQILQYPIRSPIQTIRQAQKEAELDRRKTQASPASSPIQAKPKSPLMSPTAAAMSRKVTPTPPSGGQTRPEDVKDSPEWKKKNALLNGPIINMDYENNITYQMPVSLFSGLKDIFEAMATHGSQTGVVSPSKLIETLKRDHETFRAPIHQDAHEFLNLLLNEVVASIESHEKEEERKKQDVAAKNARDPDGDSQQTSSDLSALSQAAGKSGGLSWLHDLFEGTLTSETRCLTCENISQRDEIFLDLSVDLEEHSSVTACLRKFSEEEMLCERNKFHCDNCGGLQEAEKRMKIKKLPRILALHLKRFRYTDDFTRLQKLFHRVVYPYHLRLFNTTEDADDPDRLYELYAVVIHIGGGPFHGHYVSVIKTEDRGWLLFDDELVEPVDKSYVRNFFGDKPGLACAYVLFYQETTLEAVEREQFGEEPPLPSQMDPQAKENGVEAGENGTALNGSLHAVQTLVQPPDKVDPTLSLGQSRTAPAHIATLNNESTVKSGAVGESETALSRREKAKAEKESKAAEKQKLKELELQKKEAEKQQKEQAKAAFAASKLAKIEEDKRNAAAFLVEPTKKEPGPSAGNIMQNGITRFKSGSKSLNKKMFSLRSGSNNAHIPSAEDTLTKAFIDPSAVEETRADNIVHAMDKAEEPKRHRFSLKKKASTNLS